MASSGPNAPATAVSDSTVGAVAWSTPANAISSNDTRTTAALNNQQSQYLKVTNFSFAIPTNAVILGVKAEVEKSRTAGTGTLSDTAVKLVRRGTITGQNRASQGSAWTGTDAFSTYGGETDLWGVPWTAAEINAFDFGVVFSCTETAAASATAGVDFIRITIYYQEGYNSSPQVQSSSQVFLGGYHYPLADEGEGRSGKVHETLATTPSPKIDTGGDVGRPTNRFIETLVVDDLRGGLGVWQYRSREERFRFWTSQNMNTLYMRAITLAQKLTDANNPAGETSLWSTGVHESTLVTAWGADLYTYDGAWSAVIDTLPGTPVDSAFFNGRLFWALTTNGYSYQAAPGDVATDVAAPLARSWAVWDNKIWCLDTANRLHFSTTGDANSWQADATLGLKGTITTETNQTSLRVFVDGSGNPTLWALTSEGPHIYDGEARVFHRSTFTHPFHRVSGNQRFTVNRGEVFRSSLYVTASNRRIFKITLGAGTVVDEVSVGSPDGLPDDSGGGWFPISYASDNDLLYMKVGQNTSTDPDAPDEVYVFNEVGWHNIYYNQPTGTAPQLAPLFIGTSTISTVEARRLFLPISEDTTDDARLAYIPIDNYLQNPLQSTDYTYAASGFVVLPYFDAEAPADFKTAQQVRIKLVGAGTTETVTVSYRINGSTGSYTTLGGAVAVNEEVRLPFGTNNVGLSFKSIQFKLTFASAGSTAAPKMEYFALDFVRGQEILRAYNVRIDLSDSYQGRSPQQMYDALYAAAKANIFLTFGYRNDPDNVRSSLVKVFAPQVDAETGFDTRGVMALTLVEMAVN